MTSTITITQERADAPDASALITELDEVLEPLYPAVSRHGFSVQKLLDSGVEFFVARVNGTAAACCGILLVDAEYGELKRMYVRSSFRGIGLAKALLEFIEEYVQSQDIWLLRLETGIYQSEAIALYERMGFVRIPPFGPYTDDPLSLCYEKRLG